MNLPPFDLTASAPEQCELLAALVRSAKPLVVVESGTYRGHGAIYMAEACRRNGRGHVWTADPVEHGAAGALAVNGLLLWATYKQCDFLGMLAGLQSVDFAYIDGSGPPFGAGLRVRHFDAVLEKLSPGGMILVDDTAADDWTDGEGGRSVERIRARCMNFRFLRGLSVYVAE